MKRTPLLRKTPLRSKKPFRPNIANGDTLMGIFGLKRVSAKPREPKPRARLPQRSKGRIANLEAECDQLFRTAVKLRDGHKSVKSGLRGVLECAHIFTRSRHSTRWYMPNAVTLLQEEHRYFTDHPSEFMEWVRRYWGDKTPTVDDLERLSLKMQPVTEEFLLGVREELRAALRAYHNTDVGHAHD